MRISAKGRYALAAMVMLAQNYGTGEFVPVLNISERFGISKIYLEQVFALLKRGGVVASSKGSQGGYQLTRQPKDITMYDILSSVELSLFENNDETVSETAPEIEKALYEAVFENLDTVLEKTLCQIDLEHLVHEAERNKPDETLMYYI